MSSTGVNIDKPLELIQKTYHLQNSSNHIENISQNRVTTVKNSHHQPSRKTSVHDVQEATREDFNKTIAEIHEGLARLNGILETMTAAASIRDEFGKIKLQLIIKITEFIMKLTKDSLKRSETNLKMTLTYNPQHLVYCVDYFRSELFKAQYLFCSLTLNASIGSSTLENLVVRSLSNMNFQMNHSDLQFNEDMAEIQRDLINLEEHVELLNQSYSHQISNWQRLEDLSDRLMTTSKTNPTTSMTMTTRLTTTMPLGGNDKLSSTNFLLNHQRLGISPMTQKLSTTSSTTSIEHSNICTRLYRKCQMVCCICTPNYL